MFYIAPPRKPFNNYKIIDDYAIVYLPKKTGEIFECKVDLNDLERLIKLNKHWHTIYDKVLDQYYAKTNISYYDDNGKYKQRTLYMHKYILKFEGNHKYIDHINHDTLDNRKNNLIIAGQRKNGKNRKKHNKNNKAGHINVSLVNHQNGNQTWRVQLQVNGKNTNFGDFNLDDKEDAINLAKKLRFDIYGKEYEYSTQILKD